jgi:glycosidase
VTTVWLGPVFKQVRKLETYHGYGVQDFLDIDQRFGTKEELRELVDEAHSLGLYVILDIILNHSGNVFEYVDNSPVYYNGEVFDVKGYYDADRTNYLPFATLDGSTAASQFPDGAIWPAELQDPINFTREGQISSNGWDTKPEFLDGDSYDLKDMHLGPDDPNGFVPMPALKTLVEVYKYWIAFADVDGYRLDTVKHMGDGPTRYFCSAIHEFGQRIGKERFMIVGEITGDRAYETVETTGLDAALGIGNLMQTLWRMPRGELDAEVCFPFRKLSPKMITDKCRAILISSATHNTSTKALTVGYEIVSLP